jgi:hypothetical protein
MGGALVYTVLMLSYTALMLSAALATTPGSGGRAGGVFTGYKGAE